MKSFRYGVLSDTHGEVDRIVSALASEKLDGLLFLGDHHRDGLAIMAGLGLPGHAVRGNVEPPGVLGAFEELIELGGQRILLTHGHRYHVKQGLLELYYRAYELECDWALFGHTHVPTLQQKGHITLFNPGSAALPARLADRPSWGLLEGTAQGLVATHHTFSF